MKTYYWLRLSSLPWQKATMAQYIEVERSLGFRPRNDNQKGNRVATGAFHSGSVKGHTTEMDAPPPDPVEIPVCPKKPRKPNKK